MISLHVQIPNRVETSGTSFRAQSQRTEKKTFRRIFFPTIAIRAIPLRRFVRNQAFSFRQLPLEIIRAVEW
jgi:hypothetical protein